MSQLKDKRKRSPKPKRSPSSVALNALVTPQRIGFVFLLVVLTLSAGMAGVVLARYLDQENARLMRDDATRLYQSAEFLEQQGDLVAALSTYRDLLRIDPTHELGQDRYSQVRQQLIESYVKSGDAYADQKLWREAIAWYAKALGLSPADSTLRHRLLTVTSMWWSDLNPWMNFVSVTVAVLATILAVHLTILLIRTLREMGKMQSQIREMTESLESLRRHLVGTRASGNLLGKAFRQAIIYRKIPSQQNSNLAVDLLLSVIEVLINEKWLKPIGRPGEKVQFDPEFHEPQEGGIENNTAVWIDDPGWMDNSGKVIRQALVAKNLKYQ